MEADHRTTRRCARAVGSEVSGVSRGCTDAIVVVDGSGRIVAVNALAETMFGYGHLEMIGHPIEMLVPERFRTHHIKDRSDYAHEPRTRPMGAGRPLTGRTRDGVEIPVEISLSPMRTEQETMVMSIIRDITERRRAQEQMQASLREKEALLREIHHRVKNNLQTVASLLRIQARRTHSDEARDALTQAMRRVESIAVVHDTLASGLAQTVDFDEVFDRVLKLVAEVAAAPNTRVTSTGVKPIDSQKASTASASPSSAAAGMIRSTIRST